jgi:putative hydrolase of HD superfamily
MLSNFFFQIASLKNLSRTGWKVKLQISNPESVADHSYMMAVMAMIISDIKSLNTDKTIKMSILHDWAESKIGDFMPDEIASDKKNMLEENAMVEILAMLPRKVQEDYSILWMEYKDNKSKESKFVHQLDRLEMALQAKIYEKDTDPGKIKPFMMSAVDKIHDDDLKKIFSEITQ